jgi:hypothetical protein
MLRLVLGLLAACGAAEDGPAPEAPRPAGRRVDATMCVEVDERGEIARTGAQVTLRFAPCWCGEVLHCTATADDGAIDLAVRIETPAGLCDACLELTGTCAVPPLRAGTMRILQQGEMLGEVRAGAGTGARTPRCAPVRLRLPLPTPAPP